MGMSFILERGATLVATVSTYLAAEASAQRERRGVWSVPGGITRPWDFRHGPVARGIGATTAPAAPSGSGHRHTCRQIRSYARAQELLRQGHAYLDKNGAGRACDSLRQD